MILNSQVFNFRYQLDLCYKLCWPFICKSYILLLPTFWWMQCMEHFGIRIHNFTVAHFSKSFCSIDSHTSLPLKFQAEPHTGNLKQVCAAKTVALHSRFIFNIGGSKQTSSLSFIQEDINSPPHRKKKSVFYYFCILLVTYCKVKTLSWPFQEMHLLHFPPVNWSAGCSSLRDFSSNISGFLKTLEHNTKAVCFSWHSKTLQVEGSSKEFMQLNPHLLLQNQLPDLKA